MTELKDHACNPCHKYTYISFSNSIAWCFVCNYNYKTCTCIINYDIVQYNMREMWKRHCMCNVCEKCEKKTNFNFIA